MMSSLEVIMSSQNSAEALIECVPNISEGRDQQKIDKIVAAATAVPGVRCLDVDPGPILFRKPHFYW